MRPSTRFVLVLLVLVLALAPAAAHAQTSASYRLTESVFNAGGDPRDGQFSRSKNWRITLDSIGDPAAVIATRSASYTVDGGFVVAYPPPGEVLGLSATSVTAWGWSAERSTGNYNVYRDRLSVLSGRAYGICTFPHVAATSVTDAALPPAADGYFYLVTAVNRIAEEGTKGKDSAGVQRANAHPCP
jgi:hypothetical protein